MAIILVNRDFHYPGQHPGHHNGQHLGQHPGQHPGQHHGNHPGQKGSPSSWRQSIESCGKLS